MTEGRETEPATAAAPAPQQQPEEQPEPVSAPITVTNPTTVPPPVADRQNYSVELTGEASVGPFGGESACLEDAQLSLFDQFNQADRECRSAGGTFTRGETHTQVQGTTCIATERESCQFATLETTGRI